MDARITAPATAAARAWSGWGTALKPAHEPIILARKPLIGTVAANVLTHGTEAINVDGCRIGSEVETWPATRARPADGEPNAIFTHRLGGNGRTQTVSTGDAPTGRWPANFIHDGSEEVTQLLGDAARFFYCAKASKADRDDGLEAFEAQSRSDQSAWVRKCNQCGDTFCDPLTSKPHCGHDDFSFVPPSPRKNPHPTVKPTDLMRYLCRLVTPSNGIVLDPFTGSGSTGKAALLEGFRFLGIEREAEYVEIARARCAKAVESLGLFR